MFSTKPKKVKLVAGGSRATKEGDLKCTFRNDLGFPNDLGLGPESFRYVELLGAALFDTFSIDVRKTTPGVQEQFLIWMSWLLSILRFGQDLLVWSSTFHRTTRRLAYFPMSPWEAILTVLELLQTQCPRRFKPFL